MIAINTRLSSPLKLRGLSSNLEPRTRDVDRNACIRCASRHRSSSLFFPKTTMQYSPPLSLWARCDLSRRQPSVLRWSRFEDLCGKAIGQVEIDASSLLILRPSSESLKIIYHSRKSREVCWSFDEIAAYLNRRAPPGRVIKSLNTIFHLWR
jgi:hypothetical protein